MNVYVVIAQHSYDESDVVAVYRSEAVARMWATILDQIEIDYERRKWPEAHMQMPSSHWVLSMPVIGDKGLRPVEVFARDMAELIGRTGYSIGSCGCCGVWIAAANEEKSWGPQQAEDDIRCITK